MQFRKIIHIGGVLIPVAAGIIGKVQTLALVFFGFALYLTIEVLKPKICKDILSMFYRENELNNFFDRAFIVFHISSFTPFTFVFHR